MRLILVAAAASACVSAPALAQEVTPLLDARLRWENVGQEGIERQGDAMTFRLRAGADLTSGDWSLLAEGEATAAPVERYDSGVNSKTGYPIAADPENIELNRLQLQYRGLRKALVTFGRQRINIEDQRFVGAVGWRQNEQTFDAVRLEYGGANSLRADLIYSWSVRTIWGVDGRDARQQAIGGNNVFAFLSHPTPVGTLSGFAFLVDQDEAAVHGYRLSSKSYGVRLAGSQSLSPSAKISYALSHARQSDWRRNPNNYRASYWLAEAGLELGAARFGLGHERLGSDKGLPLTSFQTPLATLHKFQGWADKFLVTPPNGIRDSYVSAGYGWTTAASIDAINAGIVHRRFRSDRLGLHYGKEWDAILSAKKGRWTATAKLAAYDADEFATDTRKLWLQLDWSY